MRRTCRCLLEKHDVAGLAGEIAYRSFLELFPFFIFVSMLGGTLESWINVQNPAEQMLQMLDETLPQGAADPVRQQLETVLGSQQGLIGLLILGVLWLAAGSGATLLKGMNRIYEGERPLRRTPPVGHGLSSLTPPPEGWRLSTLTPPPEG